ncbi:MAG: hypothetical protein NTW85_01000 [Methylococcales bacterium]|nr:hypothetical protein [Methylococcales bacterium]
MIDDLYKRLPPMAVKYFALPDDELGKLVLGWWIMAQAEANGINVQNNPQAKQAYGERVVELTQQLPDDHADDKNALLFLAIRLAAQGKFVAAGKKFKAYTSQTSEHMALMDMVSSMDEDTKRGVKTRRSARLGHESIYGNPVEKETRLRKYLDLIDEVRRGNPEASNRKVYELAEAQSEVLFGKKVSYKAFERAEKKKS